MSRSISDAKKLLKSNGIRANAITPAALVGAANQLNKSLEATLNLIAFLRSGGQGYSQFPQVSKVLTGEYS